MRIQITPEQKEEAKTIYDTYLKDFNYAIDQKKKLVSEKNLYFDLHRQSEAIDAVVDFLCFIDGQSDRIADILTQNLTKEDENSIKNNFYLFSHISSVVNYREELFMLQDILTKKSELIRGIENSCGMSEILKG